MWKCNEQEHNIRHEILGTKLHFPLKFSTVEKNPSFQGMFVQLYIYFKIITLNNVAICFKSKNICQLNIVLGI